MDAHREETRKLYFDLLFCLFLVLLLGVFFWAARDYSLASKRAPLVIMIPLAVMVMGQIWVTVTKIRRTRADAPLGMVLMKMDPGDVSKGYQILIWLVLLLLFFYFAGHLGGTALFLLIFLKFVSREPMRTSVLVALGVTASVYVLFERILRISLYEGWVYNMIINWFYS